MKQQTEFENLVSEEDRLKSVAEEVEEGMKKEAAKREKEEKRKWKAGIMTLSQTSLQNEKTKEN